MAHRPLTLRLPPRHQRQDPHRPPRAAVVQAIFAKYVDERLGAMVIANWLNDNRAAHPLRQLLDRPGRPTSVVKPRLPRPDPSRRRRPRPTPVRPCPSAPRRAGRRVGRRTAHQVRLPAQRSDAVKERRPRSFTASEPMQSGHRGSPERAPVWVRPPPGARTASTQETGGLLGRVRELEAPRARFLGYAASWSVPAA